MRPASYQFVHRNRQLALAALGFASLGLPEGLLGVGWPSIRASFGLPLDALGWLLATFATGYFISSAASGHIIGRLGIGPVLGASCSLTGVCLLGYSMSPAWNSMVMLGGLLGVGAGIIDAGLNTYAAIAHGARALNWLHAAFGIGAATGPLVMTAILSAGLGWNVGYAVVGLAQLALATAYWLTRDHFAAPLSSRPLPPNPPLPGQGEGGQGGESRILQAGESRNLLRTPLAWIGLALFFVYVGIEAAAGQWSFSLFTLSRGTPPALAGVLVSAYWASLTLGRLLFGLVVTRVSAASLLRACMAIAVLCAAVIWLDMSPFSLIALALLGLVLAPIFPVLIAETPARLGVGQTANAVGFQVAAAVFGGAALPASVGVLAARTSLEVVGPCLVAAGLVQLALHEALVKPFFALRRSAKSRSNEAATVPPGA